MNINEIIEKELAKAKKNNCKIGNSGKEWYCKNKRLIKLCGESTIDATTITTNTYKIWRMLDGYLGIEIL